MRESRRRLTWMRVLTIALALGMWPGEAWARWTRVTSPNFTFVGDAPVGVIRHVAERLEQFRTVLLNALPQAAGQSPVPTIVVVFSNERSLAPFRPLFRGRPVEVGGYFLGAEDANYIAVDAGNVDVALQAIFHEYAHFLVDNGFGSAPVWVNEGLAELYQVLEERDGGKSVLIGRAPGPHIALLKSSTLMPIQELTAIDHLSPAYNEGNRRSVFYAQSWALVHYLTIGNRTRNPQFRDYLTRVRSGAAPADAWSRAFGVDYAGLDRELFDYVHSFAFPAVQVDFRERAARIAVDRGASIPDLEADIYLGDMLARLDRVDEGRARLEGVLSKSPTAGRATAALGLIDMRAGRRDAAVALLDKAATQAPDDAGVLVAYGRALVAQMQDERGEARRATGVRAQAALARAVELNAESGFAASLFGYVELELGAPSRAVAALERAVRLVPSREPWKMLLAQAYARAAEYDRAIAVLGPLMGAGSTTDVRASARRLMSDVAARKLRSIEGERPGAPASATAAATAAEVPLEPPTSGSPASSSSSAFPSSPRSPEAGELTPVLRKVEPGETRAFGTFRSIECAGTVATLIVVSDGRSLRLRARQLSDVDFLSHRSDTPASITCGPVTPPLPVVVTYRVLAPEPESGPAVDGEAVALEMMPDGWLGVR